MDVFLTQHPHSATILLSDIVLGYCWYMLMK